MELKQGEYITIEKNKLISIDWFTGGKLDCSLETKNGRHTYSHINGRVWQKYNIKNNLPDGEWVLYHSNGQMSDYREYKKGKKCGTWKSYHDDGSVWSQTNYKNDLKHGITKKWRYGEMFAKIFLPFRRA